MPPVALGIEERSLAGLLRITSVQFLDVIHISDGV